MYSACQHLYQVVLPLQCSTRNCWYYPSSVPFCLQIYLLF